jgi:hypothetical protein
VLGQRGKAKGQPQADSSLRDTQKRAALGRRADLLRARSATPCG